MEPKAVIKLAQQTARDVNMILYGAPCPDEGLTTDSILRMWGEYERSVLSSGCSMVANGGSNELESQR